MTRYRDVGLPREPFAIEPDPAMFHPALGHIDCAERLRAAVRSRQGLALVVGEPGLGKSTIRQVLLTEWRADSALAVGVIEDPRGCRTDVQFLRAILDQFGIGAKGRSAIDLATELAQRLAELAQTGVRGVLVIDDAHLLTSSHLELLRTLLSFNAPSGVIDIVLFAEPDLRDKIARKRALYGRIGMDHSLNPVNRNDTAGMITHRVRVAGGSAEQASLFTEDAIDAVHDRSRGVPGRIIRICAAAVDLAAALGRRQIDRAIVDGLPSGAGDIASSDLPIQTRLPIPDVLNNGRGVRA